MSGFEAFKVELDDRELQGAIRAMSRAVGVPILKKAARAGAQVILAEARRRCPVKTGELKRSLRLRQKTKHHQVDVRVIASAPHAHLVEFGTGPHRVGKGRGSAGHHPGSDPKPFLRPAFDTKQDEAVGRAQHVLWNAIKSVTKS